MNRSRITGAVLLRWEDCTSILSKHLTTLLQRPIQLCSMVEDYDYWCVALKTGRFSIPELHVLLDAVSAATTDFPDLIPDDSDRTRSFSMEFSRALLQHFLHASWRYEHLTEEYLIVIDADISVPACCITNAVKSWKSGKSVDKTRRNVPPHRLGSFHQKIMVLFHFKSWEKSTKIRRFYENRAYQKAKDNRDLF